MHELSITQALVEQVDAVRVANGGGRVIAVEVRIGAWRQVVPEILLTYYESLVRDTPLEGSRVDIENVPAAARCGKCATVFPVSDAWVVCPDCASPGGTMLGGQELDLVGVELED
ncbi:MAG TPA: hydrogenase maturation nickel metallochaperone HypA [Thermoleophilia bacterium]|nr:hydrogenase maturation nickel metallochaperone HypA [Thermoleophilia bacterium]